MQAENIVATPDKKSYLSIIFSVLFVLICGRPGLGMGMVLFYLPLLIWFPYSIYTVIKNPARRKSQLIQMFIWIVAIIYVIILHQYYQKQARQKADFIVAKIAQYVAKNKTYPADVASIGLNSTYKNDERSDAHYSYSDDFDKGNKTPYLFYLSTTNGFDKYSYDFEKKSWVFFPD